MNQTLRIAVLDCDTPVPNVKAERGLYSDIFADLLKDAASKTQEFSRLRFEFCKFDAVKGKEPSEEELKNLDAIIITGSAASAYDKAPWIDGLAVLLKKIYTHYPSIKLFGSCFGHQILSHALFSPPSTNIVSKDPKGFELGVHPVTLSAAFLSNFGTVTSNPSNPQQLRQQFVHQDHVVLPNGILPEGFHSIGSSAHCALQGVWQRGRVLTYQGHAEFDRFINGETLKVFGALIWEAEYMAKALVQVDRDDDATWAATVMLKFFLEDLDGNAAVSKHRAQETATGKDEEERGALERLYTLGLWLLQIKKREPSGSRLLLK